MKPRLFFALFALLVANAGAAAQNTIYLLGEVHDNPTAHAQRFEFVETLLAKGFKPVIAMEQFDRDQQGALDRAMASCKDADCVIQQAGGKGWAWNYYKPVIETALKRRLTIVAANISAADAMKVVREGLGAVIRPETLRDYKLDQALDSALYQKQKEAIDAGHCHMLPAAAFKGMVNAQVARDVWMAKTIRENSTQGLILLAGNGHVRKDIGVFNWLSSAERARTQVIAYSEDEGESQEASIFDRNIRVEPFQRDDPCEAFGRRPQVKT
jgi:uncharacterized iron-regulated protein